MKVVSYLPTMRHNEFDLCLTNNEMISVKEKDEYVVLIKL